MENYRFRAGFQRVCSRVLRACHSLVTLEKNVQVDATSLVEYFAVQASLRDHKNPIYRLFRAHFPCLGVSTEDSGEREEEKTRGSRRKRKRRRGRNETGSKRGNNRGTKPRGLTKSRSLHAAYIPRNLKKKLHKVRREIDIVRVSNKLSIRVTVTRQHARTLLN